MVNGKSRDLLIDPSGKIVEVEEEIALDTAPAPVRDALTRQGVVVKVEKVQAGNVTTYEATVKSQAGKTSSITVDEQGKPIKG